MCLLSYFTPGTMPNVDHLCNGTKSNPDGYGYGIIIGDEVVTGHGMNADQMISEFEAIRREHPESHALFHSRFTTHGVTNESTCHPFPVGRGHVRRNTVVAHNGILPAEAHPVKGDPRSDTLKFAQEILLPRFQHLDHPRTRVRLERWLTSYNKLVILTTDPRYQANAYIFNESSGTWVDGAWHSNSGYLAPIVREYAYDGWAYGGGGTWSGWDAYARRHANMITCALCGSRGSVDRRFGYCEMCLSCVDCANTTEDCTCTFADSRIASSVRMSTELVGKQAEISAEKIDKLIAEYEARKDAELDAALPDRKAITAGGETLTFTSALALARRNRQAREDAKRDMASEKVLTVDADGFSWEPTPQVTKR